MKLGIGMMVVGVALLTGAFVLTAVEGVGCEFHCPYEIAVWIGEVAGVLLLLMGYGRCVNWGWQSEAMGPRVLVTVFGLVAVGVVVGLFAQIVVPAMAG